MQLYIVRHGIAIDREDPKCPSDPERYLPAEGVEKTRQVAGWRAGGHRGSFALAHMSGDADVEIFANSITPNKDSSDRSAAAGSGTFASFSRTGPGKSILYFSVWARTAIG